MNMLDLQDKLKGLSEQQLVQEMQMPSGSAPQFLVLSEITRRKRMRDSMQQQPDNTTVAQEAVAAAGVPQGGIADMAQALAPKTDMTQNTGAMPVQGMYGGGYVQKMQAGAFVDSKSLVPYSQQNFPSALASDPAVVAMAQRLGIPVEEYIASLSPETRAKNLQRVVNGRIVPEISQGNQEQALPSQADLDARYRMSQAEEPRFRQAPYEQFPEAGGLASPPQSLYPPVPVGNPIPGEEPSFYTPPERAQPSSPMERIRSLQGPSFEGGGRGDVFDAREPETQLAYDPSTDKYSEELTLRSQLDLLAGLPGRAVQATKDFFSDVELPYYGKPYSELSAQEVDDLSSGRMSPETADALQAGRLSMVKYGGRGSAPAGTQSTSSPTLEPDAEETPAPGGETPPAPAADDLIAGITTGGARTSGGAGGVGSASGATSYEQELMDAMQRAERRAQQDKWLALAQVGLNLMSSTQPTIGGALGEAGIAGLQSYQGARDEYETERLGLSKELAGIAAARASQRAAAAKASSGPTLQQLIDAREALYTKSTNEFGESVVSPMEGAEGEIAQINAAIRSRVGSIAAPTM